VAIHASGAAAVAARAASRKGKTSTPRSGKPTTQAATKRLGGGTNYLAGHTTPTQRSFKGGVAP